ncbi:hypothetical protein [Rhodoferax sp.]|uniref:hypothetical protein n=1 Tax=Rhodoferax sp. TaxID=50421 RepID=UPI0025D82DDE|nr:hypothetical protein [Rhodoferax sp.]
MPKKSCNDRAHDALIQVSGEHRKKLLGMFPGRPKDRHMEIEQPGAQQRKYLKAKKDGQHQQSLLPRFEQQQQCWNQEQLAILSQGLHGLILGRGRPPQAASKHCQNHQDQSGSPQTLPGNVLQGLWLAPKQNNHHRDHQ